MQITVRQKKRFLHSLSKPMKMSLITMARHYQPVQAKSGLQHINLQRDEEKKESVHKIATY